MQRYIAYGLGIESEFALPELRKHQPHHGDADVVIESGSVTPVPTEQGGEDERKLDVGPDQCRLSYDDIGSFRVEDGRRIVVDTVGPEVPATKVFRRLLEGQVLGLLCHQRGHLVLHGSAVQVDGAAVVFLGPTGAGKSTTATACYGAGYPLLDDDVVVIRTADTTPMATPGVPQLKLTPKMSNRFDIEGATADGESGVTGKTHYRTETTDVDPYGVPLAGCYVLREGPSVSVESIAGHDALLELVANTYTVGLIDETGTRATHFEQCVDVVTAASVNVLRRPEDIDVLPDIVDAVVADVASEVTVDP
jgi:hypothetical protein